MFCQHRRCPRWRKCGFWRVNVMQKVESNKLHAERVGRLQAKLRCIRCERGWVHVCVQQYLIRRPGFKFKWRRFCRGRTWETVWPFEILPCSARHSTVLPGIPAIMLNQLSMATCEGYCSHVVDYAQRYGSSVTGIPRVQSKTELAHLRELHSGGNAEYNPDALWDFCFRQLMDEGKF